MHVHCLRHTAAMLRMEAGENVNDISSFLGHSSINTTQLVQIELGGRQDKSWDAVAGMLGLE
jgi:integrase